MNAYTNEIVIEPSPRGYRFTLPEWCAPSPNALCGLRQLIKGYHKDKQVRHFPGADLPKVLDFLRYWYFEEDPRGEKGRNRNGGQCVGVRVAETEPVLGVQEPPQDYRIFNRRQADGSFRPIEQFFNHEDENQATERGK